MSSDLGQARTDAQARGRFTRSVVLVLVLVLAAAGAVSALLLLQGPRLVSTEANPDRLVAGSGGRVVLTTNALLADTDDLQVSVQPSAAVQASVRGRSIVLQFTEPLHSAEEYTVTIDGVRASFGGPRTVVTTEFRTTSPDLLYLQRGSGADGQDQILRTGLRDASRQVIFQAPNIQFFAPLDGRLLVATVEGGASSLWIVDEADRTVDPVPMPVDGAVHRLAAVRPDLTVFSVLREEDQLDLSAPILEDDTSGGSALAQESAFALYQINVGLGRGIEPVLGLDGSPLFVNAWDTIPGTTRLLVELPDTSLQVIELLDPTQVRPLNRVQDSGPVSIRGDVALVQDLQGRWILDLQSGAQQPLPEPPAHEDGAARVGVDIALAGPTRMYQRVLDFSGEANTVVSSIWRYDDGDWTEVYRPGSDQQVIESVALSPNGQYLVVELSDRATGSWDGVPGNPKPVGVTTILIDVNTALVTKTLSGFDIQW